MDQYTSNIQSKMSKIENSLSNLTNEILTATKFLFHLKEKSTNIVKNLNSISLPGLYLEEFMSVSSFILQYLNFVMELNCKFKMLEMSEKSSKISMSLTEAIKSEALFRNINKTDPSLSCESASNLNFMESCGTEKEYNVDKSLKSDTLHKLNVIKKKNSKTKNAKISLNLSCDNNNPSSSNKYDCSWISKNLNNNNNNNERTHFTKAILKNCSDINSKQAHSESEKASFVDMPDHQQGMLYSYNSDTSDNLKEILSDPEMSLVFMRSFSPTEKHNKQKLLKCASACTVIESHNICPNAVQCYETQSTVEKNLTSEIVPVKINKFSCSSDEMKDFNCNQGSVNKSMLGTQLIKPMVKQTEKNVIIKPANIIRKLGKEYDVVIETIKSPSEFYVSVIDNQSNLIDLQKKLKSISKIENEFFFNEHKNKKTWLSKEIGNYALFYSKCDEMWYRTEVTDWCLNFSDDFIIVFLLDYGESKCVSIDDIQSMPGCLKEYPAFAQRCHLHDVFPLDMDWNSKQIFWDKESVEKMKILTETSEKFKIQIAADDCFHAVTSLPVTLWLVDQENQCVNQIMVESRYAVQSIFGVRSIHQQTLNSKSKDDNFVEDEILNNWNPMKEDFESYKNCYELDMNDPAAVIYGYVGNDYNRVCPLFIKNGHCFKGGACKKEHQKLDPLGFTTDQEEVYYNAFNILPVPFPKTIINVEVTCLLEFNQFCCVSSNNLYSGEDLHSLLKFINKIGNVRQMKKLLIPPSIGQIVIARYSKDCAWYRARILESQPEKDFYTVLFVDYGNKENLCLSSIRAIEARYLHLPFQAMHCYIFGVDRDPKIPLKNVMDYIHDRIYSGSITIEVVSRLPGEGTNLLVNVFDQNGKNIGKDLIDQQYAICKEEILISNISKLIPG